MLKDSSSSFTGIWHLLCRLLKKKGNNVAAFGFVKGIVYE